MVNFGGIDALSETFTISSPVSDELQITLGNDVGQVIGTVSNNQLQPLASVQVALVPDRRERHDLYRFAITGLNGRFTLSSLPPGTYKIFTVQHLEITAVYDLQVIRGLEQSGKPLIVEA